MGIGPLKPPVRGTQPIPSLVTTAIRLPSGDHAGCHALSAVSWVSSPPAAVTVKTWHV